MKNTNLKASFTALTIPAAAAFLMSATRRQVNTLKPFAKVRGTAITYPTEAAGSTPKKPSAKQSQPQPVAKNTPRES